jgi:CheY-like chemotaxis protein
VVDDNADAANTLADMLRLEGHEAAVVYDAREVVAKIEQCSPRVLLLDIGLPGMDGYEVARQVRALPHSRQPRLVALTGYGQPEDRSRALQAGFDEHVVKPVDVDALLGKIAALAAEPGANLEW